MKTSVAVAQAVDGPGPWLFVGDLETGIHRAAQAGFDAVELHISDPSRIEIAHLAALLRDDRIELSGIATGMTYTVHGLSFADADEGRRAQAVQRIKQYIDLCAPFGAQPLVGLVRGRGSTDADIQRAEDERIRACMKEADAYAAFRQVTIAWEPINRYESSHMNRVEQVLAVITEERLRASGILADTFHMNIEEASLEGAIRAARGYLTYVHLSDSNRQAPGAGHLNMGGIIDALRAVGYHGYLSMEILPLPDTDFAARQALCTVRSLLAS